MRMKKGGESVGIFAFLRRKRLNIDTYAYRVESIDDIKIGRLFEERVIAESRDVDMNAVKKYMRPDEGIIKTKLSEEQTRELAIRFFKSLKNPKAKDAIKIIEGRNKRISINIKYGKESNGGLDAPDKRDLELRCDFVGDLRDVYILVHEATHGLDIRRGDTGTRRVLGEIAPQCMELLLDDFLLGLEDKSSYGIDAATLKEDIKSRKIIRFCSRYRNVQNFNKAMRERRCNNRELDSRYMLAQVYQAEFAKLGSDEKKKRIFEFIRAVEADEFVKASSIMGMDFRNKTEKHIKTTVEDIKKLLPVKRVILTPLAADGENTNPRPEARGEDPMR